MDFLRQIFGDSTGHLCIVTISEGKRSELFFEYPAALKKLNTELNIWKSRKGTNVYFYPMLFGKADSSSEAVCAPVIAADLDMVSPVLVTPRPNAIVESSGGRYQAYWHRNGAGSLSPRSVNGLVAYDNKLKRIPGTCNWKYTGSSWLVREVNPTTLDTFESVIERCSLNGSAFDALFKSPDRSSLARYCARMGASAQDVFLVLQAAQDSQPAQEGNSIEVLYKEALDAVANSKIPSLLNETELRDHITDHVGDSFVDKYVQWATSCTDSPKQYHVAGALMILSALLSPYLRLPARFGNFRENLWFMILAGTTMTRKTTAMEMAINLVECVDPEIVLSTDISAEGLISGLERRDGCSSIFHRDEISGFLKEVGEKGYLSGTLETLTRLYDGGVTKRTLRKQTINVKDPHFLIMCGGIKSKTIELLDPEHIESGFIPRFIMVSGWTKPEDIRPIGPPLDEATDLKSGMVVYLDRLWKRYAPVSGISDTRPVVEPFLLKATPNAWDRIRALEASVHDMAANSDNPDIFDPILERLKNSIIKISVLLAADRAFRENIVPVVELCDVVTAIGYSDVWVESATEVARGIDDKPSKDEIRLKRIEDYICKAEDGVRRSSIMQRFHLRAKEMNEIAATLIMRGTVTKTDVNRAEVYRAATGEL